MKPLISVIIPVYNVEKYIDRCLKSVMLQTYPSMEIILIDDGSVDKSGIICDQYALTDSRIHVIHQMNSGQSSARNTGIKMSTGSLITFIDSDDFVHPDYLMDMYIIMHKYQCDIVQCDFEKGESNYFKAHTKHIKTNIVDSRAVFSGFFYKVSSWGKLYRKEIIDGIIFPVGKINEDDATYYKFASNANKIGFTNRILYYYFLSQHSVMRNSNTFKTDFISIYHDRISYFESKNDKYLIDKSYERFAIVLILIYSQWISEARTDKYREKIFQEFIDIYKNLIRSKNTDLTYKMIFFCFQHNPRFIGKFINFIRHIHK